ncbi:MAG TPA: carboxypeptidase-like regulatory domain-containing protein [Terriglobales bacterium]|nr:carboxypeptidase-like regulatory domain-containing protein [Terriglobales bacterium]
MLPRAICLLFLALALQAQQPAAAKAARTFQISGTLVHALNGGPIAGAEVMITTNETNDAPFQNTVTDAGGRFLFKSVAPGKYVLTARHRGFPQQALDAHGPFSTAVAVGSDKNSENLLFPLKPEGSISGRVTDEQGDAIRGAEVMLFVRNVETGARTINLTMHAGTDDQGAYHFGHLPAGTYFVAVSAQPWYAQHTQWGGPSADGLTPAVSDNPELDVAYPITYYRETTEGDQANPLTMGWGDQLTADITLRAVPALHLLLTNQNPDSHFSIAGANLKQTLIGGNETFVEFVETAVENVDPSGIEISGIAPGRYDVGVETTKEKDGGVGSSPRHQTANISSSGSLDASAGSELATVSGTVIFEDQAQPPEATLQFHSRESGQHIEIPVSAKGEIQSPDQGEIQSPEISPGRYDLLLLSSGGFIFKSISAVNAKVKGQSIEISGPDHVQLTLVASRGTGQVEGVVLRDNKPAAGAMIVLVPQDAADNWPLFRRDQSDSDGTFTLSAVLPGKYTVLAIENGWDLEWANPAVLQPYMLKGETVQVESNRKSDIKIKLQ